jgi:hypothetical protein
LVLCAFLMVVVLAVVAFAVDLGYVVLIRTEMQVAADAAAMAAVADLPDDEAANEVALDYATLNSRGDEDVLAESDIEWGTWDADTATFTVTDPAAADSVRVRLRKTAARDNAVPLFFASILGLRSTDVEAVAVARLQSGLCGPLVGIDWINVAGTPSTDSYDSSEAPYDADTAGQRGSLCSDGDIAIVGNATINGNANPGKDCSTTIVGSAEVSGNTKPRTSPLKMPPVDPGDAATTNDNSSLPLIPGRGRSPGQSPVDDDGNFTLGANTTYHIPPGTYHFRDFTLTGQATINVSGETVIYVTGNLNTAGGRLANSTLVPSNLLVLMTGEHGHTATVIGNAQFHGVIYGPEVDITITGTGDLFGACVGKTLTMQGTGDAHYDEALDQLSNSALPLPRRPCLVQ